MPLPSDQSKPASELLLLAIMRELRPLDDHHRQLCIGRTQETRKKLDDYTFTDEYDTADPHHVRGKLISMAGGEGLLRSIRNKPDAENNAYFLAQYELAIKSREDAIMRKLETLNVAAVESISSTSRMPYAIIINVQIRTVEGERRRVYVEVRVKNRKAFPYYSTKVEIFESKYVTA